MIESSAQFIRTLSKTSNYIYYIVHLNSSQNDKSKHIFISNKKTSNFIDPECSGFLDLDLKVSPIKESINLQEKSFNTNKISFSVSNSDSKGKSFTDLLYNTNFQGAELKIYIASDGSESVDDCVNIFTGYITQVQSDSKRCEISAEDYSSYTFKEKTIPKRKNQQSTQELIDGNENIPIPMVYGQVENSKMLMTRPHINNLKSYIYPDAVDQGINILGFSTDYKALQIFRDKLYLDIPQIFQEVGAEDDPLIINGINYNLLYVGTPQYEIEQDHILIEKKMSGNSFTEGMPLNIQAREQFQVDVERTPSGIQPTSSDSVLTYGYNNEQEITFNGHQNGYNISDGATSWNFPLPTEGIPISYRENIVVGHITRKLDNGTSGEDSGSIWWVNEYLNHSKLMNQYDPNGFGVIEIVRHPSADEVAEVLNLPDGYYGHGEMKVKIYVWRQTSGTGAYIGRVYPYWWWTQLPDLEDLQGADSLYDFWNGIAGEWIRDYFKGELKYAWSTDVVVRHPSIQALNLGTLGNWLNIEQDFQQFEMVYGYSFTDGQDIIKIRLDEDLTEQFGSGAAYLPNSILGGKGSWITTNSCGDGLQSNPNPSIGNQRQFAAEIPDLIGEWGTGAAQGYYYCYANDYRVPTLRKFLYGRRITAGEHTETGGAIPLGTWVYGIFPIIGAFNPKHFNQSDEDSSGGMYVYDMVGDGCLAYGNPYFYGARNLETGEYYESGSYNFGTMRIDELNVIEFEATPNVAINADHQWAIGIHNNFGYGFGKLITDWWCHTPGWNQYESDQHPNGAAHNIRPVIKSIGNLAQTGGSYCPIQYTDGLATAVKMDITFNSVTGSDIIQGSVYSMFKCKIDTEFSLLEVGDSSDDPAKNVDFLVEADCFKIRSGDGKGHNDIIRKEKVNTLPLTNIQIQTVTDHNGNTWDEAVATNPYHWNTGREPEGEELGSVWDEYLTDTNLNLSSWIDDEGVPQTDPTTVMNECDSHEVTPEDIQAGRVNAWRENLSAVDGVSLTFRLGYNYDIHHFQDPETQNFDLNSQLNEDAPFPDNIVRGKFKAWLSNISLKQRYIVGNISQLDYYGNVLGRIDDSDGYYTGSDFQDAEPNIEWLLRKPSDIFIHILDKELDNTRQYNQSSIDSCRLSDWKFDFCQAEEIDGKNFIDDFSKSTFFIPKFSSDNYFSYINLLTRSTSKVIDKKDVINFEYSRTPKDDLILKCRVRYNWDEGLQTYLNETNPFGHGIMPAQYQLYEESYNIRNSNDFYLDFESKYIRDDETALKLRNFILNWNKNIHTVIECELPANYMVLECGDFVKFNDLLGGLKAFGIDYTDPYGYFVNEQHYDGSFIVTETKKSLKTVKITCVAAPSLVNQLLVESESGSFVNFELMEGTGDVNLDGSTNIMDVIILVNYIIGTPQNQLSPQEALIADVDEDGFVDILDLVAIIQDIVNG